MSIFTPRSSSVCCVASSCEVSPVGVVISSLPLSAS